MLLSMILAAVFSLIGIYVGGVIFLKWTQHEHLKETGQLELIKAEKEEMRAKRKAQNALR